MSTQSPSSMQLSQDRQVQIFYDDHMPEDSELLIYHHGTPGAGPIDPELVLAARSHDFRIVEVVRPGYGASTRQAGRQIADVAELVEQVVGMFGHDRFSTIGWSGGGPHALATAALLPAQCVSAISVAGVGPYDVEDLDFLSGMGQDNLDEFGAAHAGEPQLEQYLTAAAAGLLGVTAETLSQEMGSLLPEVDREYLQAGHGDHMAQSLSWAVSEGIWGWFDDDMAFIRPWGFSLSDIKCPTVVMQGSDDLMVPAAHGAWLSNNLPDAKSILVPRAGHLSIISGLDDVLTSLRSGWT